MPVDNIKIARRLAGLGETLGAQTAYSLYLRQSGGESPEEELEAALYLLSSGADYRTPYTCMVRLFNRGFRQAEVLNMLEGAFYTPNQRDQRRRYQKNCAALKRYPYLFRKDFPNFDQLPVKFFPFDEEGFLPFPVGENRFGGYVNFDYPVVSRNFFRDLEKPVFASDVFSQYELEYLNDNVRPSAWCAMENHIYLHYTDWEMFCAYLQVLDFRALLKDEKIVFLMEEERSLYPIDFSARFGIDYSRFTPRPIGVREVQRMIWHAQLSAHTGGDFFNEVFHGHPNLLFMDSVMFENIRDSVESIRRAIAQVGNSRATVTMGLTAGGEKRDVTAQLRELRALRDVTDKDLLVWLFLMDGQGGSPHSRIAPALFFQPHFSAMRYQILLDDRQRAALFSDEYEVIRRSPLFQGFRYIKTFTPMRRITTSHAASLRFIERHGQSARRTDTVAVLEDILIGRILNRSFMVDPQDRLYQDSVLVRFEDGKLNGTATFSALAAFLDLPYTESMTYCSDQNGRDPVVPGDAVGFDPVTVYRTYDAFTNDAERYLIEYFMQDGYRAYGYSFHYYDGRPMDEKKLEDLIAQTLEDDRLREKWRTIYLRLLKAAAGNTSEAREADLEREASALVQQQWEEEAESRKRMMGRLLSTPRFVNRQGQDLQYMRQLELDPSLLERPLYH